MDVRNKISSQFDIENLVWFPNPLAIGSGLGERRGQNALFFLWQPFSQPKMVENLKMAYFWNLLCVNFQKMVSEVKELILQGPRPWNSTPSNLGRFALQFGEVWKVDFSLVFLSDLSHCISLGLLYQILVCWASFFHLTRAKIELPRPNKTIAEGFLCVLTHFCTSHSCQQAGRWWRGGVWSLYLAIAVHFTSCWIFQMHFRRCSELWGGDPEIFERRVKVLESFQDLRVHHPSLPPDLHPFQVMITWSWWQAILESSVCNQEEGRNCIKWRLRPM